MTTLEQRLKQRARQLGADLVGVTTQARLAAAPPSADPSYLLPTARAVVAFAVGLDPQISRDFIAKRRWAAHCEERKAVARRLYAVGDALVALLRAEGHEALNVALNNVYRPEPGARDETEYTAFHPDFSLRYAALGAGLGRLGWSGNLITARFGARVELGSVITTAPLRPDAPVADEAHPCDRCKICSLVCPVEMIHRRQAVTVSAAGVDETIARKRPNTCCWIGCSGYEGLSPDGSWSNWSPYRLGRPLPGDKQALDALCTRLQQADPQLQARGRLPDHREAAFDPQWFYYTVCGFCRGVCGPTREERLAGRELIIGSGTAALGPDGAHVVASGAQVQELQTPHVVRVVLAKGAEQDAAGAPGGEAAPGRSPLDREVLAFVRRSVKTRRG